MMVLQPATALSAIARPVQAIAAAFVFSVSASVMRAADAPAPQRRSVSIASPVSDNTEPPAALDVRRGPTANGAAAVAATEPIDDPDSPAVNADDSVIFLTGARGDLAIPFDVIVDFNGKHEQAVTIYQWTEDANGARWSRRAFFNSYFQGTPFSTTVPLAPGQKFLAVAHYKHVAPPAFDQGWSQTKLGRSQVTKMTDARPQPFIDAQFTHESGSTELSLHPRSSPVAATAAASKTQPAAGASEPRDYPSTSGSAP